MCHAQSTDEYEEFHLTECTPQSRRRDPRKEEGDWYRCVRKLGRPPLNPDETMKEEGQRNSGKG